MDPVWHILMRLTITTQLTNKYYLIDHIKINNFIFNEI